MGLETQGGSGEIVIHLQTEEKAGRNAECLTEEYGGFCCDGPFAADDFRESCRSAAHAAGEFPEAEPHGFEKFLLKDVSRGVVGRAKRDVKRCFHFLVVVGDFEIGRAIWRPAKADAPLIIDSDRVLACTIAFEGFQSVAGGEAKVRDIAGLIEHLEFSQSGFHNG
jgi:hypothetical protein